MTASIPMIDIAAVQAGAPPDPALADTVDRACREIGFLVIARHGVDTALMRRMYAVTAAFFDLPEAAKMTAARGPDSAGNGYTPFATEYLARTRGEVTPADLKESLSAGPAPVAGDPYYEVEGARPFYAPTPWPAEPTDLRAVWEEYYAAMSDLSAAILRVFAAALGLSERFFEDKIDRHVSRLSARHYPPLAEAPAPGQLRAGAHTDFGSLTILMTDDAPGGLQVRGPSGAWADVPHVPDGFIVNIGDLMAQWTNDRWVSTLHRVVNPGTDPAEAGRRRISVAFFHQPNYEARIECLPSCLAPGAGPLYPPVTSGQHFMGKLRRMREMAEAGAAAPAGGGR
ncbi:MAG: 2-oxoglutarate and iron-dependent oxygenase domain-containing protein [Azospirillaceae bacterium]